MPNGALLYPGNTLKEDMHYFTQQEYATEGKNGPSNEPQRLRETLARRKEHYLHTLSKDIVERCAERGISTLVIGGLKGIDEQDWGRHGNKRFDNWPYMRLDKVVNSAAGGVHKPS